MAIIEKTGNTKQKWEEFVTVKLSKREAAGLLALIGPTSPSSILPLELYDELDDIVGGEMKYGDINVGVEEYDAAAEFLNNTYGKI